MSEIKKFKGVIEKVNTIVLSFAKMVYIDDARREHVGADPKDKHVDQLRVPVSGIRQLQQFLILDPNVDPDHKATLILPNPKPIITGEEVMLEYSKFTEKMDANKLLKLLEGDYSTLVTSNFEIEADGIVTNFGSTSPAHNMHNLVDYD